MRLTHICSYWEWQIWIFHKFNYSYHESLNIFLIVSRFFIIVKNFSKEIFWSWSKALEALSCVLLIEEFPRKHLPGQFQQQEHYEKMWNMFKINNHDARSPVFIVNFEHISHLFLVFYCWFWVCIYILGWLFRAGAHVYLKRGERLTKWHLPKNIFNLIWIVK